MAAMEPKKLRKVKRQSSTKKLRRQNSYKSSQIYSKTLKLKFRLRQNTKKFKNLPCLILHLVQYLGKVPTGQFTECNSLTGSYSKKWCPVPSPTNFLL